MTKVKITRIKSNIGSTERQKNTLKALGLSKTMKSVEKENSKQIQGMIEKVKHLIKTEVIK